MDNILEKFQGFDLFATFIPGAAFVFLGVLWEIPTKIIQCSVYGSFIRNCVENNHISSVYIGFFGAAYFIGVFLDRIRRIITDYLFDDFRRVYPMEASENMKSIYNEVFHHVLGKKTNNQTDLFSNCEQNKYVHNYCMTALELCGGIQKAERMQVLSEMNGSLGLVCFVYSILYFFSITSHLIGKIYWITVIALLAGAICFILSYQMYQRFRVESTLKSYYIKMELYKKRNMCNDFADLIFENQLFEQFLATLPELDQEMLRLKAQGWTAQKLAERFGYQSHSAVVKRIQRIFQKYEAFREENIQS